MFVKNGSVALVAMSLMAGACATGTPPPGLVISNVTVVSPERPAPLEHAYVRIIDGRIAEVSSVPLRGQEEIDGSGRYLVPGLIDTHVHLAVAPNGFPAPMSPEQAAANPAVVAAALAQEPRSYLYFGFTTVLDLIGSAERAARWNALEWRPDAHFCGGAMIVNGQYRLAQTQAFSYGRGPTFDPVPAATAEAAVARLAASGAACVKTFKDGDDPTTVEQLRPLVAAAHSHKLPLFIHANRKSAQEFAVEAGVDVIVHGLWRDLRDPNESVALDDEERAILQSVTRKGIGYQPTTQVIVGAMDMLDQNYLDRPSLADAYPRILIDWYKKELAGRNAEDIGRSMGIERALRFRRDTISRAAESTRLLAEGHLLFGSDTPASPTYANPPGLNGRLEMNNWIAAGVSPDKLFRALTIDNAKVMGIADRIGTVEPGKTANLLLLRGNPLQSVSAYDGIETIILHGRPISRQMLSARRAP